MLITNNIQSHLTALVRWPAGRPVGSAANRAAEDYLADTLRHAGYDVERQGFDCEEWQSAGVDLALGARSLPAVVNPFSPSCELVAALVAIGDLATLEAADLAGRIAMLHGTLTTEPFIPRNFPFFTVPDHQRALTLLEQKGALAVVCVSPAKSRPAPIIEDGDFSLPSVTVPFETGQSLLTTQTPVSLKIQSTVRPSRAANVIGRLVRPSRNKLVICAHFDTKPGTPGALDNAAGVAAVLALAQRLASTDPHASLEIVFFNGEDHYASPGEVAYINGCGSDFSRIALVVNIDGVGLKGQPATLAFFETPEGWTDRIRTTLARRPDLQETEPWPQGDHMIFAMQGVPCVAVTSAGIHELIDSIIHTPDDTLDRIDGERITTVVEFLASELIQSDWD